MPSDAMAAGLCNPCPTCATRFPRILPRHLEPRIRKHRLVPRRGVCCAATLYGGQPGRTIACRRSFRQARGATQADPQRQEAGGPANCCPGPRRAATGQGSVVRHGEQMHGAAVIAAGGEVPQERAAPSGSVKMRYGGAKRVTRAGCHTCGTRPATARRSGKEGLASPRAGRPRRIRRRRQCRGFAPRERRRGGSPAGRWRDRAC